MPPLPSLAQALLALSASALIVWPSSALAADDALFQAATTDYAAKNYEKARVELEAYLKGGTDKPEAFYYLGLIYQQLNRLPAAKKAYGLVIEHFPGSEAATLAQRALVSIDAALATGPAVLPRETWVPFARVGNAMFVDGKVNGKSQKMIFDTGAERCAFSLNQLRQLGVTLPGGPPSGLANGVGKTEGVPVWTVKIDLAVGHIERHNFAVMAGDMPLPAPLLGQDFLAGMEYSIDSSSNAISFKKKDGGANITLATAAPAAGMTVDAGGKYVYTVPFTVQGECAVVNVLVNGKQLPMIFDTGASICLFTAAQAQTAGITMTNAAPVMVGGVGGAAPARIGIADSIKLGPIERPQMRVPVTDKIAAPLSLLGQDFVKGWHYTIDKQARVIRFTKGY